MNYRQKRRQKKKMKINIVVYGCDNSGKTTLINNLVTYLLENCQPAIAIKSLGPASLSDQVRFMDKYILDVNYLENSVQIFDRFPIIEEEVCGNILRNHNNFSSHATYVSNMLNQITFFIHCNPGEDKIFNWGEREQMKGIKENAKQLIEGYKAFPYIHKITSRVFNYNYMKDDWKDLANIILDQVNYLFKEEE